MQLLFHVHLKNCEPNYILISLGMGSIPLVDNFELKLSREAEDVLPKFTGFLNAKHAMASKYREIHLNFLKGFVVLQNISDAQNL